MNTDYSETILVCEVCGARNRIPSQDSSRHYACGKCQNPLREFPAPSPECLICGDETGNEDEFLSNGSTYHQACYDETLQETRSLEQQRIVRQEEIGRISGRIRSEQSLIARLGRFFSGDESKVPHLRAQVLQLETEVDRLASQKDQCSAFLKGLYDYWLTYPPDWDDRRNEVLRYAQACESCGSRRRSLHVHHEVPISKGGSHLLDNLFVLCEKCHESQHGDRTFQYSDDAQPGPFAKKLRILRQAISDGKLIHFAYRKYGGGESVRSIKPADFRTIRSSLCVVGYCYLRKAERTFAIGRMTQVKIVETPGTCFDKK